MVKIIKQELQFEESLKQRLEFICEFSKVTPTFINGSIRKIDKTNISYIEPHRVIIKNTTFLVFNYSNDVYISNLVNKIRLSELEEKQLEKQLKKLGGTMPEDLPTPKKSLKQLEKEKIKQLKYKN